MRMRFPVEWPTNVAVERQPLAKLNQYPCNGRIDLAHIRAAACCAATTSAFNAVLVEKTRALIGKWLTGLAMAAAMAFGLNYFGA